ASVSDAQPDQCLRVPAPACLSLWAAVFTGGACVFLVCHLYVPAAISGMLAIAVIVAWLWTGTARIPEKAEKDVGRDLVLPLYASGPKSVGWWAMFITMIGDMTAFASLVFGYLYFWTIHDDFSAASAVGPGSGWPSIALATGLAAWLATLAARACNRRDKVMAFHVCSAAGVVLALASIAALFAGPLTHAMDPATHVYPATVWLLSGWTIVHVAAGVLMLLYCIARRAFGRMTGRHDIDIHNVVLYWHFTAITLLVTVAAIAGFPLLA